MRLITSLLISAGLSSATMFGPMSSGGIVPAMPASRVAIAPGTNIQTVVNGHSAGTAYFLQPGNHVNQSVTPQTGDSFTGVQGKTIMIGANIVTPVFDGTSGHYKVTGQTQFGTRVGTGNCQAGYPRCDYDEDVYYDTLLLKHMDTLGGVGADGSHTFFFDYPNDNVYISDNPAGHTVYILNTRNAFNGTATGVTIRGLNVLYYAIPAQYGAIGDGLSMPGANWVVDRVESAYNHGIGIFHYSGWKVSNSYFHHNGEMGMAGHGTNALLQDNEVAYNLTAGFNCGWEGGGTKWSLNDGLIIDHLYTHDNTCLGAWTDVDDINITLQRSTFRRNSGGGYSHEISYAMTIKNNAFLYNALLGSCGGWLWGTELNISTSQNVTISNNKFVVPNTGCGAISLVQSSPARGSGAYGQYYTKNVNVTGNDITYVGAPFCCSPNQGGSGGVENDNCSGTCSMFNAGTNNVTWSNNHYHISPTSATPFVWSNSASRSFSSWQSFSLDTTAGGGTIDSTVIP